MQLEPLGREYRSNKPLVDPIDPDAFAADLAGVWDGRTGRDTNRGGTFGPGPGGPDPRDPAAAGWVFVVDPNDPDKDKIANALRPLADLRKMKRPDEPLLYDSSMEAPDWAIENLDSRDPSPAYVLLVGDGDRIPFEFQIGLGATCNVGRVAFDSLDDLGTYVDKVVRLAKTPPTLDGAAVFAPELGPRDATRVSRQYMAEPIATAISRDVGQPVQSLIGEQATREHLLSMLTTTTSRLVYVASHGNFVAQAGGVAEQRRVNGAIVCQPTGHETSQDASILFGADLPADKPIAEGSVFFQFGCYGYGTPASNSFADYVTTLPATNTANDFVAALPKRLLAHPRGPVAFIGHADLAWVHGFDDPDAPMLAELYSPRLHPFTGAVRALLNRVPAGYSLLDFRERTAGFDHVLASAAAKFRKKIEIDKNRARLSSTYITRTDAMYHLLFGDPGVVVG